MPHCDEALVTLGQAIAAYRQAHDGANPPDLPAAAEAFGLTPWALVCPASSDGVGDCSYVFRGLDLPEGAAKQMIVAHDKQPLHKGRRNILYADGTVKRFLEDDFLKAVDKDNRLREKNGLPMKPV